MKNTALLNILFMVLFLPGCSSISRSYPGADGVDKKKFFSEANHNIQEIHIILDRAELTEKLKLVDATKNIRLIELFGSNITTPQYRVMDFGKESVYPLLGLKRGDILLAADNYIIPNGAIFPQFVNLIPQETRATINLRRAGVDILLVYSIE